MGAIPWVLMQLVLVAVLIFYPGMVTMWLDKPATGDLDKVRIEVPSGPGDAGAPADQGGGSLRDPFGSGGSDAKDDSLKDPFGTAKDAAPAGAK
jgi:hypothetical protein